jgi:hypothetical protein
LKKAASSSGGVGPASAGEPAVPAEAAGEAVAGDAGDFVGAALGGAAAAALAGGDDGGALADGTALGREEPIEPCAGAVGLVGADCPTGCAGGYGGRTAAGAEGAPAGAATG